MAFLLVALAAFFTSGLTLFSGFGLGTLLLPVFAFFLPVELAVPATAIVHGANNLLKAAMLGKRADRAVVWRFGLPAIVAAFLGAWALGSMADFTPVTAYELFGRAAIVTPLKLLMALLMIAFALLDLAPRFERLEFDRKYLPVGGVLSGFFGGLSGHQGALRSAFLAKVGISPEGFVGTNAVIALLVDLTRLTMYAALFSSGTLAAMAQPREGWLIITGTLAAFAGVLVGKRFVKKVTLRGVQRITGGLLLFIAILLGLGIL